MKRASIFLLLCILSLIGVAQEPTDSALAKLATRARLFGERIPQEKVFVQMDNTCYFLGDTIWFAAFTRRTNSGRPSKISRVLYAELWNHDGFLVERKLIEMREGRGHGFFALPDTLYSGYFELRAYTRWQLNWGETERPHSKWAEEWFYSKDMARDYFRDYEKLYSRVFPVYDKPKEQGEYNRDMTLRPLRRYFKNDPAPPKLLLSLFPEGGEVVAGMPCRIAFEAAMEDGEYMDGTLSIQIQNLKLKIQNEKGEEVTEVRTENRGRGSFTFTPEQGKTYEAVFTSSDGKMAKQKIKDIGKEGVSLQVRLDGDNWIFDIRTNLDKPLGMTIMHEGVESHFKEIKNEEIRIKNEEFPPGINQVTVFDSIGHVWADRLFFVTKPELNEPTITVSGQKDQYEPFEEIKLDVKMANVTTPLLNREGAGVSLSIRDAVRQDNTFDTGNIMTEMLLASEIKGFVPQPEWFFEKDDEEHRRALDLLMMTQGWRRFRWQDMAVEGAWEMTHPAEQSQVLEGSVNRYYSDNMFRIVHDLVDTIRKPKNDIYSSMHRGFVPYDQRPRTAKLPLIYTASNLDSIEIAQKHDPSSQRPGYRYPNPGPPNKDVRVHSEFVKPDAPGDSSTFVSETDTRKGLFRQETPRFYGNSLLFLAASDTTRWKKHRRHTWIQMEDDEYTRLPEEAEFYVKLRLPYPRWTQPYSYYQTRQAELEDKTHVGITGNDSSKVMNEVIVRSKRNGRLGMDLSKPAYVVDAYEAWNAAMDAGLLNNMQVRDTAMQNETRFKENIINLTHAFAANYMGDMGCSGRNYDFSVYLDSIKLADVRPYLTYKIDIGAYDPLEDHFVTLNFIGSREQLSRYFRLEYLDKIYIYSDYSPRWGLGNRLTQANQPSVEVRLTHYPNWERRLTYRDRRYILPGFAYQEDFYHPDYKRNPPKEGQKDYRRTLYWNPSLRLDKNGEAHVTLFNNSRKTQIQVEANGMTGEGGLLYTNFVGR